MEIEEGTEIEKRTDDWSLTLLYDKILLCNDEVKRSHIRPYFLLVLRSFLFVSVCFIS